MMIDLDNLPPRLSRKDASEYLNMKHGISRTAATLAKLACIGDGPVFRKVGSKTVAYDVMELDAWANVKLGEPLKHTSEKEAP
jgi:hypothetical protein